MAAAGRGALDRGDHNAGRALLRRASAILPAADPRRSALAPDLALALFESGEPEEARTVVAEARTALDPVTAAIGTIVDDAINYLTAGGRSADARLTTLEKAYDVLAPAGHDEGLGYYWWWVAGEKWLRLLAAETATACERGLHHFDRAGIHSRTDDLLWWIRSAYVFGPTPVPEGIERVRALLAAAGDSLLSQAGATTTLARLLSMQGDFEQARELYTSGRDFYRSAGMATSAGGVTMHAAWIEEHAGDLAAWEAALRTGYEELERIGNRNFLSTVAAYLAQCLYLQGRFDEVADMCPPGDLINFVYADALEGCLHAHADRHEEARSLVGSAVERVETTDFVFARAQIRLWHAETLSRAGETVEAARSAALAITLLDDKGDLTGAARARERVAQLGLGVA